MGGGRSYHPRATQFKPAELPSLASSRGQPFLGSKYRERSRNGAHLLLHARLSQSDLQRFLAADRCRGTSAWFTTSRKATASMFASVLTSGLKTTRQSLVDRAITLKAGDPLSPTAQTNIQKALYDLGVFANVDTAIENPDGDTDHKYRAVSFDEANRYTFSVGFGAAAGAIRNPQHHQPGGAGRNHRSKPGRIAHRQPR